MKATQTHATYKALLGLCAVSLSLVLTFGLTSVLNKLNQTSNQKAQAGEITTLQANQIAEGSSVVKIDNVVKASINSNAPLLRFNAKGSSAALLILESLESVVVPQQNSGDNEPLLPSDFAKNARLIRTEGGKGPLTPISKSTKHYIYEQNVLVDGKSYPVLGSVVRVDVAKDNEFVGYGSSIVSTTSVDKGAYQRSEAEQKALGIAKLDAENQNVVLCKKNPIQTIIVNKTLLGVDRDNTNYLAHVVDVCNETDPVSFHKRYYLATSDGEVVVSENRILDGLNRSIFDCTDINQTQRCITKRLEGDPPAGGEFDIAYETFGNFHTLLQTKFSRDSLDDLGIALKAAINYSVQDANGVEIFCDNASWGDEELVAMFCKGVASVDIVGHEISHGLTQFTANLRYADQSGSLNESISDIFAHAVDLDDWNIGEDSKVGTIRKMDTPAANGSRSQPDKLFSPRYFCMPSPDRCDDPRTRRVETCDDRQNQLVHINSGIFNHAYFLMVEGGTFNGCTISGIGQDDALAVVYKALSSYLQPTSNFRDAYDAMIKACDDVHGVGSDKCKQVAAALQAVEIDQQPVGTQLGPACSGIAPQEAATCAGGGQEPSPTPSPTRADDPTPTDGAPTPTGIGGGGQYCTPPQPGLLDNSKEGVKASAWVSSHKYGDCRSHNASGLWDEFALDCLIPDQASGPSTADTNIIADPSGLYYKHLTPKDGIDLLPPQKVLEIIEKSKTPSTISEAKELLEDAIVELIQNDPDKAGLASFDSLYLGIARGESGNPVKSASIMVHPLIERIITDEITIDERVKKLYQPFVEAFIGSSVETADVKRLYVAALNKCGNSAINGDQSGRGEKVDFGDYIGVVQFWNGESAKDIFSDLRDCNIHLVKEVACVETEVTPTPTGSGPTPTGGTGPTNTPTPTDGAGDGSIDLELFVRFQGIYKKTNPPKDRMNVRVGLFSRAMARPQYKTVVFAPDEGAIWKGQVSFDLPEDDYVLYIKGSHHLQKKIGDRRPTETYPGTYQPQSRRISLAHGESSLDLSSIYQPACDIPDEDGVQDGICNAYDINRIRSHYGERDPICDLNFDGVCNTEDHALQIETLSIRFDQD